MESKASWASIFALIILLVISFQLSGITSAIQHNVSLTDSMNSNIEDLNDTIQTGNASLDDIDTNTSNGYGQ